MGLRYFIGRSVPTFGIKQGHKSGKPFEQSKPILIIRELANRMR